jgi:hypothetical protein
MKQRLIKAIDATEAYIKANSNETLLLLVVFGIVVLSLIF